ncbi:MAG: hypothetical protein IJ298_01740 [Ruminococcus sp.]|nr:hypothetical protein [Ruminococcus sp.]
MKAIVCEMCSSHDIVKKDGMYICESCGTKYTTEEAKKMMVDISGSTVKIDTSDKLKNMYEVARRAKDDNNSETAAKYYDMILMEDPSSWEATFYSSYFSAMQTKIINIASAAYKVKNSSVTAIQMIKDNVADESEQDEAVSQLVASIVIIGTMLHSSALKTYKGTTFNDASYEQKHQQEYIDRAVAVKDMLYATGDQIEKLFTSEKALKLAALCWEQGVDVNRAYIYCLNQESKEYNNKIINTYVDKACKYDDAYAQKTAVKIRKARIAEIDRELGKIKVNYNPGVLGFTIVFAVAYIICSIVAGVTDEYALFWIILKWICGPVAVLSFCFIFRSKSSQEEQKKKIEELQKEKEELEKQINK